jgi:regulator of sirC expression with transglutaminase-like and TPR domain
MTLARFCAGESRSRRPENLRVAILFPDSPEFRRLIAGDADVHLASLALEIARDAYPGLQAQSYVERIQQLAERNRVRCRPSARTRDILGQINWVLFVEEAIQANQEDYYDPRNSYLNEVLDRRLGIPISLSVLYWSVAERVGLSMSGVNLPLHFMLRVDDDDEAWFVDPFNAGAIYNRSRCQQMLCGIAKRPLVLTDSLVAPCSIRVVATRMLRNLKSIYGQAGDYTSLLPVQRRLTALNPDEPAELRDLGLLCAQTDHPGEAIDPLEHYLQASPEEAGAEEIKNLLDFVRRQLARWN